MHNPTMMFGSQATPPPPQPSYMGPNGQNATRMPWTFVVAGGTVAVFAFALLFFVAMVFSLKGQAYMPKDYKLLMFFPAIFVKNGLTYTCCILAAGGCGLTGYGFSQLKKFYGMAANQLNKLSLYSYIQAGIALMIMLFIIILGNKLNSLLYSSHVKAGLGIPLFLLTSFATFFGLIHFVIKKEWMELVRIMNWTDKFTNFLNLGYTLAFWSISAAGALTLIFLLSLIDDLHIDFLKFISVVGMLAYWVALAGGVLWVLAQVKLGIRIGNILPSNQPMQQQPFQQPMQQPFQQPMQQDHNSTVMFQQQYQQQPYQQQQQYQQQPYQQQQQFQQQPYQQQQSQQEYNERMRQQQYEEYRRQQQERMRQMGEDSQETMPYNK